MCLCMCLWLLYVFKELDQEGLTADLKEWLSPLSPSERDLVNRGIIVNVVVFVSTCWSSICLCCLCLCQFVDHLFVDVVCVCVNSKHFTLKGMKLACGRLLQGRRRSCLPKSSGCFQARASSRSGGAHTSPSFSYICLSIAMYSSAIYIHIYIFCIK